MKKLVRNVIALSTLTAAGLHVANCVIQDNATNKNVLTTRNGHYYHWKYGNIFYTKEGNGSPILLVHNLTPDSSGYEWVKIKHQLSKQHTVYTIDLIGCGRSEKPEITYTNYLFVQLINDFATNIIGKTTDVVACGTSSTFVIMANLMNDKINKIVLINPMDTRENNSSVSSKRERIAKIIVEIPILGTYIYNILMRKAYIKDQYVGDFNAKPYYITPDMIDAYYEAAHLDESKGKYLFASIYSKYTNVDVTKALSIIKNPIHIIESESTSKKKSTLSQYQKYNEAITGTIIHKSQCLPHLELPRKTCEEIESFLLD
ncbi:MAG: alpha/beta hydrolase [Lachnospiraceae bacterium]|nr:alpha/beta hydrolase [Lachnospiraceae bacterium]